jgi:hypothetical protein
MVPYIASLPRFGRSQERKHPRHRPVPAAWPLPRSPGHSDALYTDFNLVQPRKSLIDRRDPPKKGLRSRDRGPAEMKAGALGHAAGAAKQVTGQARRRGRGAKRGAAAARRACSTPPQALMAPRRLHAPQPPDAWPKSVNARIDQAVCQWSEAPAPLPPAPGPRPRAGSRPARTRARRPSARRSCRRRSARRPRAAAAPAPLRLPSTPLCRTS